MPRERAWSGTGGAKTFTYTPTIPGAKVIGATNTAGLADPAALSFVTAPASGATSFAMTGPAAGYAGLPSAPFLVTPDATYTGSFTPSDGGIGGVFLPASLSWSGDSMAKAFTYTAVAPATVTITSSNSGGLAKPADLTYVATIAWQPVSRSLRLWAFGRFGFLT